MRHLSVSEVLRLHERIVAQTGGAQGLRDLGALQSALAQPTMTFGGDDLYPTLASKAAALAYSLVMNHPFLDGNKRVGHAAMEIFLVLNGYQLHADTDEQERLFLDLAAGLVTRDELQDWVERHLSPK